MNKILFIVVFFLLVSFNCLGQRLYLCQSDTLREFSVLPSSYNNDLQWDFISGNGAQIIQGKYSDKILVNFLGSGDFVLQFKESIEGGCFKTKELEITVYPPPSVSFTMDQACLNQETKFFNTSSNTLPIVSCLWNLPNYQFQQEDLTFTFLNTGDFPVTLEMIDEKGCTNSLTQMVSVTNPPLVDFYISPQVLSTTNSEFSTTNLSSEGKYFWDFGDDESSLEFEPVYNFESAGWQQITLYVEDENGCVDSVYKEVLVEVDLIIYLPNAFTPDGNVNNEFFGPVGFELEKLSSFNMQIINNWGEVIFESNDIGNYWNGNTKDNKPAMVDTYTWSIRIEDELGKKYHKFGSVDLIR